MSYSVEYLEAQVATLCTKLGLARGMLISAHGVIEGTLPPDDCTTEDIAFVLSETAYNDCAGASR